MKTANLDVCVTSWNLSGKLYKKQSAYHLCAEPVHSDDSSSRSKMYKEQIQYTNYNTYVESFTERNTRMVKEKDSIDDGNNFCIPYWLTS